MCVCVCTHAYTEKLLVIILPANKFCKQYFCFTHGPLIIYTIKKVDVSIQCLTHFLNTISLHYQIMKKKLIAFPYIWYKAFSFTWSGSDCFDCFLFNQATCLHGLLQFDFKLKINCSVLFVILWWEISGWISSGS